MIFVPLPLFLTGLAVGLGAFVLTRTWMPWQAKALFCAATLVIMVETVLVALRFAYQIESVLVIQRLLPFWIGPLVYLGYIALSDRADRLRRYCGWHLGLAGILTGLVAAVPPVRGALDLMIGLSYAGYALALLRLWRSGPDCLSHVGLAFVPGLRRVMALTIGLLVVTLVMDSLIALDFARNSGQNVTRLLSLGSLILLGLFGLAALWGKHAGPARPAPSEQDATIVAQATAFLVQSRLFTDPDLSLTRLARRIGVTDQALSGAINRQTGHNVSHFINGFRVEHAALVLRNTDDPVAVVAHAAGFLTRSNFYTEFQRVHGQSPGSYRKGA